MSEQTGATTNILTLPLSPEQKEKAIYHHLHFLIVELERRKYEKAETVLPPKIQT